MTKKKLTGPAPILGGRAATPLPTPCPFPAGKEGPTDKKGTWRLCVSQMEDRGWIGGGEEAHFTEWEDGTQPLLISLISIWAYQADLGCFRKRTV